MMLNVKEQEVEVYGVKKRKHYFLSDIIQVSYERRIVLLE